MITFKQWFIWGKILDFFDILLRRFSAQRFLLLKHAINIHKAMLIFLSAEAFNFG